MNQTHAPLPVDPPDEGVIVLAVTADRSRIQFGIADTAARRVRLDFNPSGSDRVSRLKVLAAALLSEIESQPDAGARERAIALTHAETAVMWAVKAATAAE